MLWEWFSGTVFCRLVTTDHLAVLHDCNAKGIALRNVRYSESELILSFIIAEADYPKWFRLSQKKGYEINEIRHTGFLQCIYAMFRRPILMFAAVIVVAASFYLPTRVLFIAVDGNEVISTRQILDAAEGCGIGFGASRREVRSEKMKNALLQALPRLQWAGINTTGCTAVISVREKTQQDSVPMTGKVSSIVANMDGVISDMTVMSGNGLCKTGQAVKKGQVLISGYTDCGITIRATQARGEIYAQTNRSLKVFTPSKWENKGTITGSTKKYALIFGKNRINFYKGSGISDTGCDKIYSEKSMVLPGGFVLPVTLVTEEWTYYDPCEVETTEEAVKVSMEDYARSYLQQHMIAGQILSSRETILFGEDMACLEGKYACREMIGTVKNEETVDSYGNS